jgi:2-iminobutanoate/2-iminopropanoate deaminase
MTHLLKEQISSDKAPKALGPYSAGIRLGNLVFTAGQLGIIPASGDLAPGGIDAETRQAL